jgi:uncharacterized protein YdeI (BOF family)
MLKKSPVNGEVSNGKARWSIARSNSGGAVPKRASSKTKIVSTIRNAEGKTHIYSNLNIVRELTGNEYTFEDKSA